MERSGSEGHGTLRPLLQKQVKQHLGHTHTHKYHKSLPPSVCVCTFQVATCSHLSSASFPGFTIAPMAPCTDREGSAPPPPPPSVSRHCFTRLLSPVRQVCFSYVSRHNQCCSVACSGARCSGRMLSMLMSGLLWVKRHKKVFLLTTLSICIFRLFHYNNITKK